jgi:hypothetical protein
MALQMPVVTLAGTTRVTRLLVSSPADKKMLVLEPSLDELLSARWADHPR